MNKLVLFAGMLIVVVGLAFADYAVTAPGDLSLPQSPAQAVPTQSSMADSASVSPSVSEIPSQIAPVLSQAQFTQAFLAAHPDLATVEWQESALTQELFERFDARSVDVEIYKTALLSSDSQPLYVYEIPGAVGQGRFNFLSLKLAMTTTLNSNQPINQTDDFGQASLFYNDATQEGTGFLLVQVRDNVYGFMYPKASSSSFDWIQAVILTLNNS